MMRSLYSAVSGLKTHQTKMDVIGNNIANVNTVAFKSTSVNFNDVMYQTTQNASGSNALTGTGGTNAKQIGLGVTTASMKVSITSEGAAQSTGEALDLKITGESFFVVNNGTSNYFTRDGSFYLDGEGNLCMSSTGYNVMGWQIDPNTGEIKKDTVSALRVKSAANMTSAPEATSMASVAGVLDANSTDINTDDGYTMSVTIYDNLGYSYTAKFAVTATPEENPTIDRLNVYTVSLKSITDQNGNPVKDINGNEIGQSQIDEIWGAGGIDDASEEFTISTSQISQRLVSGYKYQSRDQQVIKVSGDNAGIRQETPQDVLKNLNAKGITISGNPVTLDDTTRVTANTIPANGNLSSGFSYTMTLSAADVANLTLKDPYTATTVTSADLLSDALGINASDVVFTNGTDISDGVEFTTTVGEADIESMLKPDPVNGIYYDASNGYILVGGLQTSAAELKEAFGLVDKYYGVKNVTFTSTDDIIDGFTYTKNSNITAGYHLAFDADDGSFKYINFEGESTATMNMAAILGDSFSDVTVDFTDCKNYDNAGTSTLGITRGITSGKITSGTGRILGSMTGISVQTNGMIYGSYDNGDTILLGQIAVASFANASGLESLGNNCYAETLNSGSFDGIGQDVTSDGGSMNTGQLEMSNVDLSAEFTSMITTQRGFQANSRVITTSDTMLEELINLKR